MLLFCNGPTPTSQAFTNSSVPADVFLDELAYDTWTYLSSDWATENHLPWSWRSTSLAWGDYANPAEIGFYALSWLAAYDMQKTWSPAWGQTETEVNAVLDQLRAWQTGSQIQQANGANAYNQSVFYQTYWVSPSPPVVGAGTDDHLVPSVDNAWLAASLITIREYAWAKGQSAMAQKADDILTDMDFTLWYHTDTHRFSWGTVEDPQGGTQADYYSNENRIINFVARALGQISAEEFHLSLAVLQKPSGSYGGSNVNWMAWDGSYFTYAGPTLFIKEMDTSYGRRTILPATQAQIDYAADQGYSAWGFSDCFDLENGAYIQQGAPPAGKSGPLEFRPGLVTPHASALALITTRSSDAITNLQAISDFSACAYDPTYGFRDAAMANPAASEYGACSNRFSALAQEWLFLSIADHTSGFLWNYFYRDAGVTATHSEMFPPSFADVPANYWSFAWIERLYDASVTGGCSLAPLMYCPETEVNRAQMAVFLLRGEHGSTYVPPTVGTGTGFTDVPADYWSAAWIKQLAAEGITSGCGPSLYCPETSVTRDQMAVFLLRAEHGASYTPPPATGVFTDVPTDHWAAPWIEQLAVEGITGGCGADIYCPSTPVTRAQMAVFLVRTFSLP